MVYNDATSSSMDNASRSELVIDGKVRPLNNFASKYKVIKTGLELLIHGIWGKRFILAASQID